MPIDRAELESSVNPESGFDRGVLIASLFAWPCIVLFLAVCVIPPFTSLDYHVGKYLVALGTYGVCLFGMSELLIRALRISHSWPVIKAALLAVFGGPGLTFVLLLLNVALATVLEDVAARFVGWSVLIGGAIVCVAVGSYWSGYRFGTWGPACGAVSALPFAALSSVLLPEYRGMTIPVEGAAIVLAVALGAVSGAVGADRYQRRLVKEAWRTHGAATPDTSTPV